MLNDWTGEAGYKYPGFEAIFGEHVDEASGTVSAVSIEDMVLIDEEIAAKVLVDEHSHSPILYEAPYPNARAGDKNDPEAIENNTVWLEYYANYRLPVPRKRLPDGTWEHDPHDTDEEHLLVSVLAPRELQDEISQAARIGARERREDPTRLGKGLLINGEKGNEYDPLNWSGRGGVYRSDIDAINVIDSVTDSKDFVPLMAKLRSLPGATERSAFIQTYKELAALNNDEAMAHLINIAPGDTERKRAIWAHEEMLIVAHVAANRRMMISVANFNMRHLKGRNLSEKEQNQKADKYFEGLVRVANKISHSTARKVLDDRKEDFENLVNR